MARKETVSFSLQLATLMIEHEKLFSSYLKENYALSYNDFVTLSALFDYGGFVPVEPLADFILLKKRTVIAILLYLEDLGLIKKVVSDTDKRQMLIGLSKKGRGVVAEATADLDKLTKDVFWDSLPEHDFTDIIRYGMRRAVDCLRGHPVKEFESVGYSATIASVEFQIFWKTITDTWSVIVQNQGLSFSEFRILSLIMQFENLAPHEVAEQLIIPRSIVSIYKAKLVEKGLLLEVTEEKDKRRILLLVSDAGKRMTEGLLTRLNVFTQRIYSGGSDELLMILNAWHFRMYRNLKLAMALNTTTRR